MHQLCANSTYLRQPTAIYVVIFSPSFCTTHERTHMSPEQNCLILRPILFPPILHFDSSSWEMHNHGHISRMPFIHGCRKRCPFVQLLFSSCARKKRRRLEHDYADVEKEAIQCPLRVTQCVLN